MVRRVRRGPTRRTRPGRAPGPSRQGAREGGWGRGDDRLARSWPHRAPAPPAGARPRGAPGSAGLETRAAATRATVLTTATRGRDPAAVAAPRATPAGSAPHGTARDRALPPRSPRRLDGRSWRRQARRSDHQRKKTETAGAGAGARRGSRHPRASSPASVPRGQRGPPGERTGSSWTPPWRPSSTPEPPAEGTESGTQPADGARPEGGRAGPADGAALPPGRGPTGSPRVAGQRLGGWGDPPPVSDPPAPGSPRRARAGSRR
jgi:hypothetical protein